MSIGVPYCSCSYGYDAHQVFCYDFWNLPNINNFAVGVHADTAIRVRGIAMFYPRTKLEQYTWVNHNIRREWIEHGRNRMTMQLMDIEMNVQAEGFVMLSDSIGKPVFQIIGLP